MVEGGLVPSGRVVAKGALTWIMINWQLALVAGCARCLPGVIKGHIGPICHVMAVGAGAFVMSRRCFVAVLTIPVSSVVK